MFNLTLYKSYTQANQKLTKLNPWNLERDQDSNIKGERRIYILLIQQAKSYFNLSPRM